MFFLMILVKQTIMNQPERNNGPIQGNQDRSNKEYQPLPPQEKTSLGGDFNSGVTSNDPSEKDEIEKKGAMANIDQSRVRTEEQRKAEEERS